MDAVRMISSTIAIPITIPVIQARRCSHSPFSTSNAYLSGGSASSNGCPPPSAHSGAPGFWSGRTAGGIAHLVVLDRVVAIRS
jgi:hypothetical protein